MNDRTTLAGLAAITAATAALTWRAYRLPILEWALARTRRKIRAAEAALARLEDK